MQRALRLAVTRLAAAGVPVRWLTSITLPEQSRSLYLLVAGDRGDVVLARDTAGLPNAVVLLVLLPPECAVPV